MSTLGDLLAASEGGRLPDTPADWLQGRTAYGGVSAALALHAAARAAPDLPPLRSAQVAFVGPLAEALRIEAALLRRGRSSAFVEARISSAAGLGLVALFLFGARRESGVQVQGPAAPQVPRPEEAEPAMRGAPLPFIQRFEYRHALPPSERSTPRLRRWVRLREREGLDPATELLAVGDALPPGVTSIMTRPAPLSSANWTVHLLTDTPATRDGWWLLQTTAEHAEHGVSAQSMAMWNTEGEAVAVGSQSVAVFG